MRPLRAGLAAAIALAALALPARAEVHDSLPDLLSAWVAIQEDPTPPWEAAWLRYEASQSAWLDATLWAGHTPAQKAEQLDQTLHETGPGFAQQMGLLTAFERDLRGFLDAGMPARHPLHRLVAARLGGWQAGDRLIDLEIRTLATLRRVRAAAR